LRYAAIVESTDDAIIAKSVDGVISAWNVPLRSRQRDQVPRQRFALKTSIPQRGRGTFIPGVSDGNARAISTSSVRCHKVAVAAGSRIERDSRSS
jgi:hypothetical protein